MSDMNKNLAEDFNPAVTLTVMQLKEVIRAEIDQALRKNGISGSTQEDNQYLSVKEAHKFTGLGESTIRLYYRKGKLKYQKVGSRVLIKKTDLEQFIDKRPAKKVIVGSEVMWNFTRQTRLPTSLVPGLVVVADRFPIIVEH